MTHDRILIVDVDEPVKNVFDTGASPSERDLVTVRFDSKYPSMEGDWKIVGVWCERAYGEWRVRLHIKRSGSQ